MQVDQNWIITLFSSYLLSNKESHLKTDKILLLYYPVKERSALNEDNYEIWRKKLINSVTCKSTRPLSGTPPFYSKNGCYIHFDDDDDNDSNDDKDNVNYSDGDNDDDYENDNDDNDCKDCNNHEDHTMNAQIALHIHGRILNCDFDTYFIADFSWMTLSFSDHFSTFLKLWVWVTVQEIQKSNF